MNDLARLAADVGAALRGSGTMLATAESCTGGWIAQAVTSIAGSSEWFERGFVTYSDESKVDLLGVSPKTLQTYGSVSEATAREMARGALERSRAAVSVAVTGIAGPGGGSKDKPVGLVCFAWGMRDGERLESCHTQLPGDREAVRHRSVAIALEGVVRLLRQAAGAAHGA